MPCMGHAEFPLAVMVSVIPLRKGSVLEAGIVSSI